MFRSGGIVTAVAATSLSRLQRETCIKRLAQMGGADRVTIGRVEELLLKRSAAVSGASSPVFGVRPARLASDARDEIPGLWIL
jgi:hypothetical protein